MSPQDDNQAPSDATDHSRIEACTFLQAEQQSGEVSQVRIDSPRLEFKPVVTEFFSRAMSPKPSTRTESQPQLHEYGQLVYLVLVRVHSRGLCKF